MQVKHILVPIDYSDDASQALQWGVSLAKQYGARLLLLHVIPKAVEVVSPQEPGWDALASYYYREVAHEKRPRPQPIIIDLEERARAELHAFVRAHISEFVPLEVKIAIGKPAEEIVRVARETEIDLIVMGTHGRTGVRHVLLGSVAERVVRAAPCPVFTVRLGLAAAA